MANIPPKNEKSTGNQAPDDALSPISTTQIRDLWPGENFPPESPAQAGGWRRSRIMTGVFPPSEFRRSIRLSGEEPRPAAAPTSNPTSAVTPTSPLRRLSLRRLSVSVSGDNFMPHSPEYATDWLTLTQSRYSENEDTLGRQRTLSFDGEDGIDQPPLAEQKSIPAAPTPTTRSRSSTFTQRPKSDLFTPQQLPNISEALHTPTKELPAEPAIEGQLTKNEEPFSIFTVPQKKTIVLAASLAGLLSPMSSAIYYPSLSAIATDLNVSDSQINLTVTTYMGLAPMMIAGFSDKVGRRPAYIICLTLYFGANLGLALENSYTALLILRMLQSAGSSGTVALSNGVVGDMITSAERGTYIAFASLGAMLGPTISPIIGGLMGQYLGWHWIFWFLLIFGTSVTVPILLFLPETCRNVVGNGSIPPPPLNSNLTDMWRHRKRARLGLGFDVAKQAELRKNYRIVIPNPIATLRVCRDKETTILLLSTGLALACSFAISSGASAAFDSVYGFDQLQTALMFIPLGAGSILSAFSTGKLVDWNYRRHARLVGLPVVKNKRQDLAGFPIEVARLQISFPLMLFGAACIVTYGWIMGEHVSLAGPAIMLFLCGYALTAIYQVLSVLLVDIWPGNASAVTAASNLVRCELGAAASAAIVPMVDALGDGLAYTVLTIIFIASTPALLFVMKNGVRWRRERKLKTDEAAMKKAAKKEQKANARATQEMKNLQ